MKENHYPVSKDKGTATDVYGERRGNSGERKEEHVVGGRSLIFTTVFRRVKSLERLKEKTIVGYFREMKIPSCNSIIRVTYERYRIPVDTVY